MDDLGPTECECQGIALGHITDTIQLLYLINL